MPRYRDLSAYTWRDRAGAEWLGQTLVGFSGEFFQTRTCPIDHQRGVQWASCTDWSVRWGIGKLGLGVEQITNLGEVAFKAAGETMSTLVQTAFIPGGAIRLGRLCSIPDKEVDLATCTEWTKLVALSSSLGIQGVDAFRDQDSFSFLDATGETRFVTRLVGYDGTVAWSKTCPGVWDAMKRSGACSWEHPLLVSTMGLATAKAVSGMGGYVYDFRGEQMFAETYLSMDGTQTARRECPLVADKSGIDTERCTPWTYNAFGTAFIGHMAL